MSALNLSVGRVSKYAAHLPTLLHRIGDDVKLKTLTKADAERIVAANSTPALGTTPYFLELPTTICTVSDTTVFSS